MTGNTGAKSFIGVLQTLLPDAVMSVTHERPWHSLTFTGVQLCLSVTLPGNPMEGRVAEFVRMLPGHEFRLAGQLVADVAVTEVIAHAGQSCLSIDALLLDD
jgi:hypothetical protein